MSSSDKLRGRKGSLLHTATTTDGTVGTSQGGKLGTLPDKSTPKEGPPVKGKKDVPKRSQSILLDKCPVAATDTSTIEIPSKSFHVIEKAQATNMAALKDVVSLYQTLKVEWTKKPPNVEKCGVLLAKLKVGLTHLMFLPTSNVSAPQQELLVARDILEIGAQHSIAVKDIPSFERYMAQLKCYYLDYREQLPESTYKYQLLGLNLLFLLSQNRVAEFHTELELLPSDQIQSNVYIRHPLSLEQYLMEGSYNKIFLAKGNVPAESYNFFIDILLDTIRSEIAACMEKAYEKISLNEAARMLNFQNQAAITEYGRKKNWVLGRDNFYHFGTEEKKVDDPLPSTELAEQALEYARELEMIV
ncbi:26S proteasome non-ATPase regulatory subunit 8 [Gryllus bimaculatus]|nr:26S proteasome non-ATPase regulatory subunit 8 [Gryllus bimaculatus]